MVENEKILGKANDNSETGRVGVGSQFVGDDYHPVYLANGQTCTFLFEHPGDGAEIVGSLLSLCRDLFESSHLPNSLIGEAGAKGGAILFDVLGEAIQAYGDAIAREVRK